MLKETHVLEVADHNVQYVHLLCLMCVLLYVCYEVMKTDFLQQTKLKYLS